MIEVLNDVHLPQKREGYADSRYLCHDNGGLRLQHFLEINR